MARLPKVKMLKRGSHALLTSREVENDISRRANAMATSAGPGFEARVTVGNERVLGSVSATTFEAARAESEGYALSRSLDAAR